MPALSLRPSGGAALVLALSVAGPALPESPPHFVLQSGRGLGGTLALSPDGRTLAAADHTGIQLVDLGTRRERAFLTGMRGAPRAVAFSPDGQWLASGSEGAWGSVEHPVQVWDLREMREARSLVRHRHPVSSVAFTPDGERLLSAGANATVVEWDWRSGRETAVTAHPAGGTAEGVALSPDGRLLVVVSGVAAPTVAIEGDFLAIGAAGRALAAAYGDEGQRLELWNLATRRRDEVLSERVQVWDLARGAIAHEISGYPGSFAFTPDGGRLAWIRDRGPEAILNLSEVKTGRVVRSLAGPSDDVLFTRDGRIVGLAPDSNAPMPGWMSRLAAWDSRTGSALWCTAEGGCFAVSPDGTRVATGSNLYDLATGRLLQRYSRRNGFASSVAFSPDGRWLAVGYGAGGDAGSTRTIVIWDARSWREAAGLSGHDAGVTQVAFSPDGALLVSASYDRTLRVWSLEGLGREAR